MNDDQWRMNKENCTQGKQQSEFYEITGIATYTHLLEKKNLI
jgi:hypothetical protein